MKRYEIIAGKIIAPIEDCITFGICSSIDELEADDVSDIVSILKNTNALVYDSFGNKYTVVDNDARIEPNEYSHIEDCRNFIAFSVTPVINGNGISHEYALELARRVKRMKLYIELR